jgi:imidazolonepropionase-like amidohydrolase
VFLIGQAIPVLFGLLAYAWPIYTQTAFFSNINVICARKIFTASENSPNAECFAYSAATGLFTVVGTRNSITREYPKAPIRDLGEGMTVLPGLYDSHGHIMHVLTFIGNGIDISMVK